LAETQAEVWSASRYNECMTIPRTNRRDFLKGKAAAEAVVEIAQQAVDAIAPDLSADPTAASADEHYLVKFARRAMACQFEVWLNAGEYDHGGETALAALDLVDELEDQLTVYREHSEISRLNRTAVGEPVEVETRLFGLLSQAIELWRLSSGAFDITAGKLSELWGFKRRAGRLPSAESIAETLQLVGSQHLEVDAQQHTVRFRRAGIEINLGAIGKGYALDRCAEVFAEAGVEHYLLHGGNSSVVGRGSQGAAPRDGWSIGIRNPLRPEERIGEIRLRDRALATSGSGTQYFIHEGRRFGHILDPRSGWPAEGVLAATVLAPTAAEADALSTACYVLGPVGAQQLCHENPQFACLMICPGERVGSMTIHQFGLSSHDLRLYEDTT
jgi:thiamine biosynthesis lipoprotein